jgi:archaellum component FlaF (FlaF/FlaG flagellin family)
MRRRAASVARWGIAAVLVLVSAYACGGSTPSSPTSTTTTTTIATTSTTTVLTSSVLTVALAANCAGVVQASGLDVFLDGVLVGVATQNQPFVRTVSIGTHRIRARDRNGFLPETTVDITTATFLFTISCA